MQIFFENITLWDRNPQKIKDINTCNEADFQYALQRKYFAMKKGSNIMVNVLKQKETCNILRYF